MKNISSIKYGFASSRDLLEKLSRDRQVLRKAFVSQHDESIKDAIFNFCVTAHSIKDWIKKDDISLRHVVENFISDTPDLAICADIANSCKHGEITRGIRASAQGSMGAGMLTADMTSITGDMSIPLDAYTVRIYLDDGTHREILDFSNRVNIHWENFIKSHGL